MTMSNHDRAPFGPIKTKLGFSQLQAFARLRGTPLLCGMCGHQFPEDATTGDHECKPPLFQIEVVEVKPLPMPQSRVFQFMMDELYPGEDGLPDILKEPL